VREIKFRGKRLDNGEWVYGDLLTEYPHHNGATIVEHGCIYHEVDPATVGQFTGLPDKNGVEIFGGDIVTDGKFKGKVFWDDTAANYAVYDPRQGSECAWEWYEVIGNIYENPELLK
jgi:uncharacterized phage protein (TIGR01671 family)